MQYHTGQFSYYCDLCRKGFAQSSHYKDHVNKHKGVRYYCEVCTKSFARERVYQSHLSVHTGEYKIRCEQCGKGFNLKHQLEKHYATHATIARKN